MPKLSLTLQILGATLISVAVGLANTGAGIGIGGVFVLLAGLSFEKDGR